MDVRLLGKMGKKGVLPSIVEGLTRSSMLRNSCNINAYISSVSF
jgi:hypothetical protein